MFDLAAAEEALYEQALETGRDLDALRIEFAEHVADRQIADFEWERDYA